MPASRLTGAGRTGDLVSAAAEVVEEVVRGVRAQASAQASTIFDRRARACDDFARRAQRVS